MAASRAAERGLKTLLLEKNPRPGIKILMSGGTRCNVTHSTDARGIVNAYGRQGPFLHSALAVLSPSDLLDWLNEEGVATKVESTGKVFPVSDKASDVLDALLRRLRRSGAKLSLGEPLRSLKRKGESFELKTPDRILTARNIIITTGGRSYPRSGTTGDGYTWAAQFGHTVVEPCPALTPITSDAIWVRKLQGVTVPDVAVRILPSSRTSSPKAQAGKEHSHQGKFRPLAEARVSFLFTHFGISGSPVLDVSRVVARHPDPVTLSVFCDFVPERSAEHLSAWLEKRCTQLGRRQIAVILSEILPRRLADTLCRLARIPEERSATEVSKSARRNLISAMKATSIPASGVMGFKKAEVTAGGVTLKEVDSKTMQSKLVPGLYFAGEILDLDGPIGGFNFQAAFSTGALAGEKITT
ncbi:MAG: NAD(P)/FAD-dependent oxidoreductase [Acidobacteriota bacterium]|nr:MAG: NAD(P)/FAD-dependent oxidoreductase [Acidobacteriota bacterium]